ncbi:sentrin-specific protease 1-like [Olea europaea subsp. europaea]|uniref:Sentrin-specific protease 1-like n=1 Tax=Olea europaea subsp. europaea TaxID=158383 RepID=A0A8S0TNQ9_OLEEU|nr:sentrin-specific protease 1-like [Olea europaea subsp. europaea]
MSEESVPLITDTGVRQAHITDDDDDFVDPPRRSEVISHQETLRANEDPSGPQHSPNEEQHHGIQGSAVLHDLNVQISEIKLQNKVLTVEMDAIKSQMSSLNSDQAKKISEIILMQGRLKHDMIEIRTNMQFLSEFVTAMISSSMDEILRRFNDRKGCPVDEFTEAAVEGFEKIDEVEKLQPVVDRKWKEKVNPTEDVAFPSSLEPPSFDLVKRASRHARILRSPFVVGEGKHMDVCFYYIHQVAKFGKVKFRTTMTDSWFQNKIKDIFPAFQKDPQVLLSESNLIKAVTGHLISLSTSWADVDYVFMPLLPTNKAHWMLGLVEFRSHTLMLFNSAGKTYRDWKVLEGIEPYVKVLPALMKVLGISKKDPDYNESECKQMKVTIDSTLPQ